MKYCIKIANINNVLVHLHFYSYYACEMFKRGNCNNYYGTIFRIVQYPENEIKDDK